MNIVTLTTVFVHFSTCAEKIKFDMLHGYVIYYNWVGSSAVEHPTVTRKTCVQLTTYPHWRRKMKIYANFSTDHPKICLKLKHIPIAVHPKENEWWFIPLLRLGQLVCLLGMFACLLIFMSII